MAEDSNDKVEPLAPGWKEYFDDSRGRAYFVNKATNETTWSRKDATRLPDVDKEWDQFWDPGRKLHYFVNNQDKRATWSLPVPGSDILAEIPPAPASSSSLPPPPPPQSSDLPPPPPPARKTVGFACDTEDSLDIDDTDNDVSGSATADYTNLPPPPVSSGSGEVPANPPSEPTDSHRASDDNSLAPPVASHKLARPSVIAGEHLRTLTGMDLSNSENLSMQAWAEARFSMKKKLFGAKKTIEALLSHSSDLLQTPLHKLGSSELNKIALHNFKYITYYMGDRVSKKTKSVTGVDQAKDVLTSIWNREELRDELYCGIIKQLTKNVTSDGLPNTTSITRGWQLLALCTQTALPSQQFRPYLKLFLTRHAQESEGLACKYAVYALYQLERLEEDSNSTGRSDQPPSEETVVFVKRAITSPFHHGLEELMLMQHRDHPDLNLPWILPVLIDTIKEHGGHQQEGIFRIPAAGDALQTARNKLDQGDTTVHSRDPHVAAALLKIWFRELREPLIPPDLYDSVVKASAEFEDSIAILEEFPVINRDVLLYLIDFLNFVASHPETKMNQENLSLVFAPTLFRSHEDDPSKSMLKGEKEQAFLQHLLSHRKAIPLEAHG